MLFILPPDGGLLQEPACCRQLVLSHVYHATPACACLDGSDRRAFGGEPSAFTGTARTLSVHTRQHTPDRQRAAPSLRAGGQVEHILLDGLTLAEPYGFNPEPEPDPNRSPNPNPNQVMAGQSNMMGYGLVHATRSHGGTYTLDALVKSAASPSPSPSPIALALALAL